jgi:hypothetical protein
VRRAALRPTRPRGACASPMPVPPTPGGQPRPGPCSHVHSACHGRPLPTGRGPSRCSS